MTNPRATQDAQSTGIVRTIVDSAAALVIGDEILSGKINDENTQELALAFRQLGIPLVRTVTVPDHKEIISEELTRLRALASVVITSGGVGPTHDDVTVEAVAHSFGVSIYEDENLVEMLRNHYKEKLTAGHLRMALVPEGADLVTTKDVQWPTIRMANVWLMPGIPQVFRTKLLVLREHLVGPGNFFTRALYTLMEEGQLKALIDSTVEAFPDVSVGSYPKWFDPNVKTKITFDSGNATRAELAMTHLAAQLPNAMIVARE